jgi:hypothetical protein
MFAHRTLVPSVVSNVNDAAEDISSNPAGTILITYFREFPTLTI